MKVLVLFLLVYGPWLLYAQSDSIGWDRTMEGVNKRSRCLVDTVITVHSEKKLIVRDTVDWSYEFVSGSKTYLEVKIRSTVCSCSDCSFADHILVDVTDIQDGAPVALSVDNTHWFIWNSWMIGHAENTFAGTLDFVSADAMTLELYKYVPGQSWLTYDGIKIVRK